MSMVSVTNQVWRDPLRQGLFNSYSEDVTLKLVAKAVDVFILNLRSIGDFIRVDET